MKSYPSIPKKTEPGVFHVFDKLDGSNIRAEWTPKAGLHKFGSRTRLLGTDQDCISKAEDMLKPHEARIHEALKQTRNQRIVLFFEFYGPGSFAGTHVPYENHQLAFLDAAFYKHGVIAPKEMLALASEMGLTTPKLLHHGVVSQELLDAVRESRLSGMTFEGIVCKGAFDRRLGHPVWFKVKSRAWLEKLRSYCGNNTALFEQLS